MLTFAAILGVLGLLGLGIVLADARPRSAPGDPRCYVVETPLRQIQVHTLPEVCSIIEKDLAEAEPGQAAMVLVRTCR